MNNTFSKFATEINFDLTPAFKGVDIVKATLKKDGVYYLDFIADEVIPFNEMKQFIDKLTTNFKYKAHFQFNTSSVVVEPNNFKQYVQWTLTNILKKNNISAFFNDAEFQVSEGKNILVTFSNISLLPGINGVSKDLLRILDKFGFNDIVIDYQAKESEDILAVEKEKLAKEASEVAKKLKEVKTEKKDIVAKRPGRQKVAIDKLKEVSPNSVLVEGEVFKVDSLKTKSGWTIFTFSITNKKEAINVKMFANKDDVLRHLESIQVGNNVSVSGQYTVDSYSKENIINGNVIKNIGSSSESSRVDDASDKRVELSTRTKMSTMDGIMSAKELINRAVKWGHKAIAVVDTDSVQSFPDLYNISKSLDLKVIYGATLSTTNRDSGAVFEPVDKSLAEQEYVVFDLETTGLSPIVNEIIEFGAVRVKGGQVIDRKQFFIKPEKPIPRKIQQITNITDADVANGTNEKDGVKQMLEYFGDAVLVAHNAKFDVNFLKEKLEKYSLPKLTNTVVDTLITARIVFPKAKRYRLESVADKYKIEYDSTVAHRADYDAEVLFKVWTRMITDLAELELNTFTQLGAYVSNELRSKSFFKEVSVLAKNQEGLKELFKYISVSHTQNMVKKPFTIFEDLSERKNTLLGTGGMNSRLMDLVFTGSKQQIRDEIAFYDYVEIISPRLFVQRFDDISRKEIEEILRFIITEAQKQGKIVVATGDVRYLDIEDKIYHEIYINAKGLGGMRHNLFRYNVENPIYPDMHMLNTEEMLQEFSFVGEIGLLRDIVVNNTNMIADMIDKIEVIKKDLYNPEPNGADQNLRDIVYKNAHERYGKPLPKIVEDRIERELNPIINSGYAVIYWISHLLVGKSLKDGYLVGSRGSVGSSFVATMAEITEVNPLEPHYVCSKCKTSEFGVGARLNSGYDLPDKMCETCNIPLDKEGQNIPFETFLGFNADKVPDIDLNFSGEYQPIIHNEVKEIFGDTHAFRAGTISTVAEKTAFGYVRAWSEETNTEISKSFTEFLAKRVAGTKRTTGQHPGGIIVVPKKFDVEDFTAVNFPANDANAAWKTTHFDFHAIHDNLLKLDLLGHDDPTAIKYLEKLTGVDVKKDIPFFDQKIIDLFSSTEPLGIKPEDIDGEPSGAMGIPEFGTTFVRRMLKTAKITSFGDLISVSGLSHGTDVWSGNAESVIREHGKTLSEVISCRDNIMTDLLAKDVEPIQAFNIMEKVRKGKGITAEEETMLKGKGVEAWYIDSLQKIKYMFPKAHATAYVMMAWRIAWFKLYRPEAYYATYFTTRADVFDLEAIVGGKEMTMTRLRDIKGRKNLRGEEAPTNKELDLIPVLELAVEAFARGIKISNISLEKSDANHWIIDKETNELIPPFVSLDGLGESVGKSIMAAREEKPFTSLEDLQKRTSINKTAISKLKELGVMDGLSESNQISILELF